MRRTFAVLVALLTPWGALAASLQTPVDRTDPGLVGEQLEAPEADAPRRDAPQISREGRGGDSMTSSRAFTVGAVRVEGSGALPHEAFASAIEPYLGRQLGAAELRALARDVADVARRAGFGLATAWVPPQDVVNGVLRVRLDEGRIEAIEVEGPAQGAVQRRLAGLADGRPVRTAELERRLLVAGDLAGVNVGQARLVRRGGRNVLVVATAFERRAGRVWLDNYGSDPVGPVRLRLNASFNGLAATGDRLNLGGVVTPLQPREFQFAQAAYSVPLGPSGTEASVRGYVGHSEPGAELRNADLGGTSFELAAGVSHPLLRSRAASLWGSIELSLRDSEFSRAGLLSRDDRIAAASLGLHGSGDLLGGTARVRLSLVQGLDLLGATERGDPLASRNDAGGRFTKLAFSADWVRRLGGGFSLNLRGEGQLASRPLLSSEEMGLGGQPLLRGYEFRERAGDQGAAGAAELRFDLGELPRPLRRAQLYAFVDAGRVTNLRAGTGGGTLVSAGAGVRLWARHGLEGSVELGVPLADGFGGQRPDPRLSFAVGARF